MKSKALFLHFLLAGIVSGYAAAWSLILLYTHSDTSLTLFHKLVAAVATLPFYCILTFPAAMILTPAYYLLRRTVNSNDARMREFILVILFTSITAATGFVVGNLVRFTTSSEPFRDLIITGSIVGAVIGFAEYFVWRHALESHKVAYALLRTAPRVTVAAILRSGVFSPCLLSS